MCVCFARRLSTQARKKSSCLELQVEIRVKHFKEGFAHRKQGWVVPLSGKPAFKSCRTSYQTGEGENFF